jgi:hypothetical protein
MRTPSGDVIEPKRDSTAGFIGSAKLLRELRTNKTVIKSVFIATS